MVRFIWNVLAVIGLICVVVLVGGGVWAYNNPALQGFDPRAGDTYANIAGKLLRTGNIAEATVWKFKVADGLSFKEVDESIKSVATANNIRNVGELPLSDQVEAMTGKPWRKLKIYLYCNPLTAAKMVDYSEAYAAYLPCRIAVVEDKKGQLWIYSLDMDPMIYGGKQLPPELRVEAENVRKIIRAVMKGGAKGEF